MYNVSIGHWFPNLSVLAPETYMAPSAAPFSLLPPPTHTHLTRISFNGTVNLRLLHELLELGIK